MRYAPIHPISPSSEPRSPRASASPSPTGRRRVRAGVPRLPLRPALARRRRVPALHRDDAAALARVPLEVALLRVPLPVQRHRRHALPQLAPAGLEVVRRRPPDARVARGPLGQRAPADARRQLQDGLVRRPPDPGGDARPRRRAAAQPRRRRAAPRPAPQTPPELADLARRERTVLTRMRRLVGGPHHQLSVKYLPAYIDERRWRSDNEDNPHVFRDTIQALLEGEGISYERLVAAV